jgi:hypothetical protein
MAARKKESGPLEDDDKMETMGILFQKAQF